MTYRLTVLGTGYLGATHAVCMAELGYDVTAIDLGSQLADYNERREADRRKLKAMVSYCQTAQCRTRLLLEYFGEEAGPGYVCGHCDNDANH